MRSVTVSQTNGQTDDRIIREKCAYNDGNDCASFQLLTDMDNNVVAVAPSACRPPPRMATGNASKARHSWMQCSVLSVNVDRQLIWPIITYCVQP